MYFMPRRGASVYRTKAVALHAIQQSCRENQAGRDCFDGPGVCLAETAAPCGPGGLPKANVYAPASTRLAPGCKGHLALMFRRTRHRSIDGKTGTGLCVDGGHRAKNMPHERQWAGGAAPADCCRPTEGRAVMCYCAPLRPWALCASVDLALIQRLTTTGKKKTRWAHRPPLFATPTVHGNRQRHGRLPPPRLRLPR